MSFFILSGRFEPRGRCDGVGSGTGFFDNRGALDGRIDAPAPGRCDFLSVEALEGRSDAPAPGRCDAPAPALEGGRIDAQGSIDALASFDDGDGAALFRITLACSGCGAAVVALTTPGRSGTSAVAIAIEGLELGLALILFLFLLGLGASSYFFLFPPLQLGDAEPLFGLRLPLTSLRRSAPSCVHSLAGRADRRDAQALAREPELGRAEPRQLNLNMFAAAPLAVALPCPSFERVAVERKKFWLC